MSGQSAAFGGFPGLAGGPASYLGSAKNKASAMDWWFMGFALVLLSIGLVMVFSSSGVVGSVRHGDKYYFFKRQFVFAGAGLFAMATAAMLPRALMNKMHYPALFLILFLLVIVLSPLGSSANGARRWINLGPMSIQPMEFGKIALVMYLGYFMSAKQAIIKTFSRGIIPPFAVTGVFCVLLLAQPDFGGAAVFSMLLFFMCLVGGTRIIYLVMSAMLALGGAVMLVLMEPYRLKRLTVYLDPFRDPAGSGHQLVQSFLAMGSGGFTGVGLGASKQKLMFLPEGHTDFIMALLSEEIGFLGVSVVLLLMALLVWRGLRISLRQGELRDRFTAFGLTLVIAISMVLNLAVITGTVPPKGVPMPFFSYGGSSLLTTMICVGLLFNYSRTQVEPGGRP